MRITELSEPVLAAGFYEASGFFVVRTPLLPLIAWTAAMDVTADESEEGMDACELQREYFRELLRDPAVREAVFLASPTVEAELQRWLEGGINGKLEGTIAKYVARMSYRCTPFGLFAGCSLGRIGSQTALRLAPRERFRRKTRVDCMYLTALLESLAGDRALSRELPFEPNTSIYRIANRGYYSEGHFQGHVREYILVAFEADDAVLEILNRAGGGATLSDLVDTLRESGAAETEATDYVEDLVRSQLLVPTLAPLVTGDDPLGEVIAQLEQLENGGPYAARLGQLRSSLETLDERGIGNKPDDYREIANQLDGLPATPDLARLFQVDLLPTMEMATLDQAVVDDVIVGIQALHDLFAERDTRLDDLRSRFAARYGEASVPLMEMLDDEHGLGLRPERSPDSAVAPLLKGLQLYGENGTSRARTNAVTSWLHAEVHRVVSSGGSEMVFAPEATKRFRRSSASPFPNAMEALCAVLPAANGEGPRVLLRSAAGPSGARLLGRFCNADDALKDEVRRLLRREASWHPDAIMCEIVHLPQGRLGNILMRPVLREYELPFLGRSGAESEKQIALADLSVSVMDNRFVLRSQKLGREIIPRLTAAHNTDLNPHPVYQFLGWLQYQGVTPSLTWSWGSLSQWPSLPRVRCGRTLLSRAMWRCDVSEADAIRTAKPLERLQRIARWRARVGAPRLVVLVDNENALPIDLEDIVSVGALASVVGQGRPFTLEELLPAQEDLVVKGRDGRYAHEIVLPLVRRFGLSDSPPRSQSVHLEADGITGMQNRVQSTRKAPGSEWSYIKWYGGPACVDRALRECLVPTLKELGADVQWFYLRYADPEWHIRIRCKHESLALPSALSLLSGAQSLVEGGVLWRVQMDTYDREVERYGGPEGLEVCERIFHADSEAALSYIRSEATPDSAGSRWGFALQGMHRVLLDFGFDGATRYEIVRRAAKHAAQRVSLDPRGMRSVLDRYRTERRRVMSLIEEASEDEVAPASRMQSLALRSGALRPLAGELALLETRKRLRAPRETIAASIMHLHANRVLRSDILAQEMVIYQFLERSYESEQARRR